MGSRYVQYPKGCDLSVQGIRCCLEVRAYFKKMCVSLFVLTAFGIGCNYMRAGFECHCSQGSIFF